MTALSPHVRPGERVFVVGATGYGNVGDEAMLAGLLVELGGCRVTVLSRDPLTTRRLHGVATVGPRGVLPALRDASTVVIGGGALFGRDMGRIGRALPAFGLAAVATGRRVIVEGVDLDDELAPAARSLVPALLRRVDRVAVRDRGSVEAALRLGVTAELRADLSASMAAADPAVGQALLADAGLDLERPIVGLALSGVRPALGRAAVRAIASAMDELPGVQFAFLPMSHHPSVATHDDLLLGHDLRRLRHRLVVVEASAHPAVVLSSFGALSAVVAMRYHGMLFAERMGAPLVPIVYAEKNTRWLADHDLRAVVPEPSLVAGALRRALGSSERHLQAVS